MARDLYEVIGVMPGASKEEIASAYKKAVVKAHPDRNPGDPEAVDKLVELNSAYSVLSDDVKRAQYDVQRAPHRVRGQGVRVDFDFGFGFGHTVHTWSQEASPFQRAAAAPGKDVEVELRLTLKEAVLGAMKSVRTKTGHEVPCPTCGGSRCAPGSGRAPCAACVGTGKKFYPNQGGKNADCRQCGGHGDIPLRACHGCAGKGRSRAEKELSIRIPTGVTEDQKLRLAGQGEVSLSGGISGDMYVVLKIDADERFSRKGNDLHTTVRVPFHVAAGGKPIKVVGIDGVEHVVELASTMRPGETRVAVQDAGVPSMAGPRGRLIVLLQADLPAPRTPRGNMLLRELISELSGWRPSVPSPDDDHGRIDPDSYQGGDD